MAARFCPYCGTQAAPGGAFCASCGASLGGAPAAPGALPTSTPPVAPTIPYGMPYVPAPGPAADTRATDRAALGDVFLAAILALVGVVLSFVDLFGTPFTSVVTAGTNTAGNSVTVNESAVLLLAVVGGIGIALGLVELWLYRRAFRTLATVDPQFSTPSKLVLLLLIAIVFILLILVGVFYELEQAISCAGAGNPIPSACINTGALLGLLGLIVLFAIVALVGAIGLLLGIWRLGNRYHDGLFKAGAILLIFPVLNFIGVILILVAANRARENLARASGPMGFV